MAKPLFFDIHTHVHFEAFRNDAREVAARALENGTWMIQVGTQKDTSQSAVNFTDSFSEGVYATIGLHPIHIDKSFHDTQELGGSGQEFTSRGEEFDYNYYRKLAEHPKVVAVGECGLDYYRIENPRIPEQSSVQGGQESRVTDEKLVIEKQKNAFEQQVQLALDTDLPLMIHCRPTPGTMNAYKDLIEILSSYFKIRNSRLRGNAHFFAGSWEVARWFLDIGFSLSFTGVITFTHDYDEVIQNAPLDMIMSETDAPYVSPVPYRGKRNEPLYVSEVVKRIAEIRGEDYEKVREALVGNALRVFDIQKAPPPL